MLDIGLHQGCGLHSYTPQSQLRVLAVVSQDDGGAGHGMEALWQICASLQRLGYPVVVLDGTAPETEDSPGLLHLLQQSPWSDGARLDGATQASSLAVIPAARGLVRIARDASRDDMPPLPALQPYFRAYGLVVLHAAAATLAPLLTHTPTMPLVVMGAGSAGMLASYASLKQIALYTGLPCMVAALLQSGSAAEHRQTHDALLRLQDCAERHLGGPVRTTTIAAHNGPELQRLALQLLENAGTIGEPMTAPPPSHLAAMPAQFARSH